MKYQTHPTSKNGWTKWIQPKMSHYRLACCDCGLVHDMRFRVVGGRVQFKVSRNNRATGQMRRMALKRAASR